MWKRFHGVLVLVFLRQRHNLFVENYNINRLCPGGATLRFSIFLKLTGCAAGAGFALIFGEATNRLRRWRKYSCTNFKYEFNVVKNEG